MTNGKRSVYLIAGFLILYSSAYGQTTENGGWLFISHTQKITTKFDLLADIQLRTSHRYEYLSSLLLRGAIAYNLSKNHSIATGYAFKSDWQKEDGQNQYMREHRVYEQYIFQFKSKKTEFIFRARLEQRFVKEDRIAFSQRARALFSAQIPLIANDDFSKGLYGNLQNEIFINIMHKEAVNHSLFDQNRPFVSIGYRWNKNIDSEIGYMPWYQKENEGSYLRNIVQLMITTNF